MYLLSLTVPYSTAEEYIDLYQIQCPMMHVTSTVYREEISVEIIGLSESELLEDRFIDEPPEIEDYYLLYLNDPDDLVEAALLLEWFDTVFFNHPNLPVFKAKLAEALKACSDEG